MLNSLVTKLAKVKLTTKKWTRQQKQTVLQRNDGLDQWSPSR